MPDTLAEIEARAAASAEVTRAEKRAAIVAALEACGGNRTRAAEMLRYHNAAKLRRAAARVGLDLATIPAPTPQEYGGLRRGKPAQEGVSGNRQAPPKKKRHGR